MPRLPEERTVGAQGDDTVAHKAVADAAEQQCRKTRAAYELPKRHRRGGAEIAFASAPETGSRRRAAKTKTPAAVIIKAGIRKEYRQFRMAASVPDIAHAMK